MTREKNDFYPTPPEMTHKLLRHEFHGSLTIHEPACGNGAMSKILEDYHHDVISSDLIDRGYGRSGVDYLLETQRPCDYLVTNPPYKLAEKFIQKALDLGYKRHAWLLRLSFLEGQGRFDRLFSKKPFDICYVFSKRQTIWRGNEAVSGNGTTAYAWFVWDKNSNQKRVEWI